MLYNWYLLLIPLAWICIGIHVLDYLKRETAEPLVEVQPRWLNLLALFVWPLALIALKSGNFLARFRNQSGGRCDAHGNLYINEEKIALDILDSTGKPVTPFEESIEGYEAINTARKLLLEGIQRGATRIWVIPDENGEYDISMRIDGATEKLRHIDCLPGGSLVSAFKHAAGLKVDERRIAQNGRFTAKSGRKLFPCLIGSARRVGSEKITVRMDSEMPVLAASQLGMLPEEAAAVGQALEHQSGLILLCGPAGCGKTTTYYAMLTAPELDGRSVVSIENPVDRAVEGIDQREVNALVGNSCAALIGKAVEAGATVIGIGSLSEPEGAKAAMNAARNGHLVIAGIDSGTAVAAIARLNDWESSFRTIGSAVILSVNQRLLRKHAADGNYAGAAAVFEVTGEEALGSALTADGASIDLIGKLLGSGADGSQLSARAQLLIADGVVPAEEAERLAADLNGKGK